MVMNLVHHWLIFYKFLIALIIHYYLQNFMGKEYHMHRLSWPFDHPFPSYVKTGICISRPPALCLAPGPGPQFVFTGPGTKFVFTGPGPQFVFIGPGPQCVLTDPGQK